VIAETRKTQGVFALRLAAARRCLRRKGSGLVEARGGA
jgi:hypothetical protein